MVDDALGPVLPDLARVVAAAPRDQLPQIIGELERAKAAAWMAMQAQPVTTAPPTVDRNISADEAAQRLGMSKDWLYKNAEHLPFAVRIGRRVLFSTKGMERWSAKRRNGEGEGT
jgi:predicted DNA-binding transcriptional regulator AlpA